jgi:hypothetical protein
MKNSILILALAVGLGGCAMKTKVLDATAVSMTHSSLKEGEKLQETGPVTGKFCADTFGDKGTIGLLDESIGAAQKQFQVDYITNASFWREGSCISVEGTGAKIVASNSTASPMAAPSIDPAPTATKSKKKKH